MAFTFVHEKESCFWIARAADQFAALLDFVKH